MKIIDLSQELFTGMPVFPGDPEVKIEPVLTIEDGGWLVRRLEINSHDGTHVNLPAHVMTGGKTVNNFGIEEFVGDCEIYFEGMAMNEKVGVIFRDQNIDKGIAEQIKLQKPKFVGLSEEFEFDLEIEKDLLLNGIISYEKLANLKTLPNKFKFYGVPLKIRDGEGSPVRAFAVVE